MTTPTPPTGPEPMSLLVAVTRVEVKVDALTEKTNEHGRDIRDLKGNQWPMRPAALLLSLVGTVLGAWALIKGH